jgi:dolichol-phosphate mannosyltransferase
MRQAYSVIVPVRNEGEAIVALLDRILPVQSDGCEVLVIFDTTEDITVAFLEEYARSEPRLRAMLNTYGMGPAKAIRFGFDHASSDVAVVTMADGSDEPELIWHLAELVRSGAVVAAASRYMPGGRQIGGPFLKSTLSRAAGLSLHHFARLPIHDATSAFKGYSIEFVRSVGVRSDKGFEIALELVAKAHRLRLPMAELPTVWRDRTQGTSNFRMLEWLPHYLRWYLFAFGRRLTLDQLKPRTRRKHQ